LSVPPPLSCSAADREPSYFRPRLFSGERQMNRTRILGLATTTVLALLAAPLVARAQTATVYGSLGNFDVVNNTGQDAHGFEIELDGLQAADVAYTFSVQRYGVSTIAPPPTGVAVRWTSRYD